MSGTCSGDVAGHVAVGREAVPADDTLVYASGRARPVVAGTAGRGRAGLRANI